MRTTSAIRDSAENVTELANETIPEKMDLIVGCVVLVTLMVACTCLVIVAKR